jgi:hypothetical protein
VREKFIAREARGTFRPPFLFIAPSRETVGTATNSPDQGVPQGAIQHIFLRHPQLTRL